MVPPDDRSPPEPAWNPDAAIASPDHLVGRDDDFGFGSEIGVGPKHFGAIGPGSTIGGIEIVGLLAVGGMGRVYTGRQESPARTVVVKVLRETFVSPAVVRRFKQEAEILGCLTHPGIARIYAAGVEHTPHGDIPYSIMEFVVGAASIVDHASRQNLSPRERVDLFTQVAAAVTHAHREGIVHRDLKPGNIVVDAEGHPKVIDFGIARALAASSERLTSATDLGQLLGTLRYMAPEQLGINGADADARSDVYALGLVLHELLVGTLPYELGGKSVIEAGAILGARAGGDARQIDRLLRAAGVSRAEASPLAVIVATCLEPRPADRYQHAGDVEADLRRWLAGEAVRAKRPSLVESVARLSRRHRAAVAAFGVVFVAVITMLAAVCWAWRAAESERVIAATARSAAEIARRAAEAQGAEAEARATDARRQLYFSTVLLAAESRDRDNLIEARRLLAEARDLARGIVAHPLELDYLAASLDESLATLDARHGTVTAVATARLRDVIAAGTEQGHLVVWQPGQVPRTLAVVDGRIWGLSCSPDGTRLAVGTLAGRLLVFEVPSGLEVASIDAHEGTIYGLDFSPDARTLASASRDRSVRLWDTTSWSPRGSLTGHEGTVLSVAFSPTGKRILTTSSDGTARIWNGHDGQEITRMGAGDGRLFRGAWNSNGRLVATASEDGKVRLHDAATGTLRSTLVHPHRVNAIAFASDDRQLVTASGDAVLRSWDIATESVVSRRRGHGDAIWSLAVRCPSPGGASSVSGTVPTVTGSADGTVRTWDLGPSGEPLMSFDGRGVAVATSSSCDVIAVSTDSGEVHLVDPKSMRERQRLTSLGNRVNGLAFAPDGTVLAATDDHGVLHRWTLPDAKPRPPVSVHVRRAFDVAFSPDGKLLATGGEDRMARILDPVTGEDRVPPLKHPARVFCVAFDPRGARLATACEDRHVRLWDTATGSLAATWPGHDRPVNWVSYSRDGSRLASASSDGTVRLWHVPPSRRLAATDGPPASITLTGPSKQVWKVAFSLDGSRIAATSADSLVQLWDAATGRSVSVLRGHRDETWGLAFLGDGRSLATTSWDGTLRLWGVPMISLANARAPNE